MAIFGKKKASRLLLQEKETGPLDSCPGSPQGVDTAQGAELVTESKLWYYRQNERLFKVVLVMGAALLISLIGNAAQFYLTPTPKYFATTPDLRIMEMPPLNEPVVGDQALANWTAEVITQALSLDFLQYREKLMGLRAEFDPQAYNSFVKSLTDTGNLAKIRDERLNLSCVITAAPTITNKGLVEGVMTWKMELPLLLSYQSSKGVVSTQKLIAQVLVQRTATTRNPKGVVLKQIVLVRG